MPFIFQEASEAQHPLPTTFSEIAQMLYPELQWPRDWVPFPGGQKCLLAEEGLTTDTQVPLCHQRREEKEPKGHLKVKGGTNVQKTRAKEILFQGLWATDEIAIRLSF